MATSIADRSVREVPHVRKEGGYRMVSVSRVTEKGQTAEKNPEELLQQEGCILT
jgi:hypothetical protein